MFPLEKITSGTINNLLLYISIVGLLLVVASLIRLKVHFLRKAFIPASLLAGVIGLALGPYALKIIPAAMMTSIGALPSPMITIVFSCMLLGVKKEKTGEYALHDSVTGLLWLWSNSFMQVGVTALLCVVLFTPFFGVNPLFGSLFEIGFAGGHGTAGGMASLFEDPKLLNWIDGASLAPTVATIGLLIGIFGGMGAINYGVRKRYTKVLTGPTSGGDSREIYPEGNREASAKMTVSQDVVEPFALHLGVIGIAVIIGRLIVWSFGAIFKYKGLPLFPFAMIGGWLINIVIQHTSLHDLFDRATFQRIQGMALEILIVAAMASIKIPVVVEYWMPLLIATVIITVFMYFWLFWLSPRVFSHCWFEQGIIRFGAFTGVAAVGYMLLRTSDTKMETDAGTIYALGCPLMSPFIGGGLVTTMYPYFIKNFGALVAGLVLCTASIALIVVMRLFFWNRTIQKQQR